MAFLTNLDADDFSEVASKNSDLTGAYRSISVFFSPLPHRRPFSYFLIFVVSFLLLAILL
jgi:hypothetical protein